jgi:hypothetical protein
VTRYSCPAQRFLPPEWLDRAHNRGSELFMFQAESG